MAISFVNIGTTSATADTATPFTATSYPLPSGAAADDLLLVTVGVKPTTDPSVPGGWLKLTTIINGSVAAVADGGSVRARVDSRTMVAGDTAPSYTWSAQYNPQHGSMLALRKTNPGAWTVDKATGSDAVTSNTTFTATGDNSPAWAAGDWAVVVVVTPTDAGAHTSPVLSIPGCTVGTLTQRVAAPGTTQGLDLSRYVYTAEITAGTASGAPTFTATGTSGATGSAQGSVIFVMAKEPAAAQDATVTPATVLGATTVPTPSVSTPSTAAVFALRKTGGGSRLRAGDQLRLGASTVMWATALPVTVTASTTIATPSLFGPPLNRTATPVATDRIDLAWSAVATATGYDVERDGVVIAWDVAGTTYQDIGVTPGVQHDYRLRAVRAQ